MFFDKAKKEKRDREKMFQKIENEKVEKADGLSMQFQNKKD